ncbi:MAG: hypothetical protein JSR18_10640 [Proteobacteria bacterium]|nr:hypothetical protein [Pseudomonadota bacterium]
MRLRPSLRAVPLVAIAAAAGTLSAPVAAGPCYEILDRNDAIIYQSAHPPVDLSPAGASQREALRKAGKTLINFDTASCPERIPSSKGGTAEASVEEIVAGIKPYKVITKPAAASQPIVSTPSDDAPITMRIGG